MLVYTTPRTLFGRIEDTGAYGWALGTLLAGIMLIGYVEMKTGLIDRSVDQRTERALAELEKSQAHVVDRIELRDRMQEIRKAGEFNKLLARLAGVVFAPAQMLASLLLISSMLYGVVALSGRKPEYHTLMAICVYAGFVVFLGHVVRLAMVITYRTIDVDTSLAMLSAPGKASPLSAVDPFRIWFWVLVAMGLVITRQLSRRSAIVSCTSMAFLAAGARVAVSMLPAFNSSGGH